MSAAVATARPSQALRQRRETQRPSLARAATRAANNMDNGAPKEDVKRYVYTQEHILAKFKGCPPSLRVYMHQNHFRLNDSQETLSYASPMKELLQHLRLKTVPHNMLEEFHASQITFYDECLIVEVHNHRTDGPKAKDETSTSSDGSGAAPFSIHNYNSYITPSPHVPYPTSLSDAKSKQSVAQSKGPDAKEEKDIDKENMPAPGQPASQKQPNKVKVTTVVLFPTQQSRLADMQILATTPMPDPAAYRRNQAAGRAAGNPPTPLTAMPPTPTLPNGRSPKRQKMMLDDNNVHEFEAAIYDAQCPKLYLEPTKSLEESVALMQAMTHPNSQNPPPVRKTRKRTTAELAADEADAAEMQRYMLAGDEYQANQTGAASGGDDGQHAARSGANQNTFARFKTLATIKMNHEQEERRKKEEEARQAQLKRQAQMEAESQKRRDMETNRLAEQNAASMQQQKEQMMRQQHQQQQQQQLALQQASQAQQMANAMAAQASQTPLSATQPQFSSPVVRQQTPMTASAGSPLLSVQASHTMGGTPMIATSSNHNAGSPARPPSAVSHHANAMARSASQQQNPMSRTGTPGMVQGTPVMNSAMPARNISSTPTPRINHGSPPMQLQGSTPIMMHTPQPGQNMTPEQVQMAQQQNHLNQLRMQQIRQQQQQNNMSPGHQQQMQQTALQRAQMQIQSNGIPAGQNPQAYRQALATRFYQMEQQRQQQQAQQAQQQVQQQAQQQNQQGQMSSMSPQGVPHATPQAGGSLNIANMNLAQLRAQHLQRKQALIAQFGGVNNVPHQHALQMRQLEHAITSREQAQQAQQLQQQQQQLQQNNQLHMNPGMPNQMTLQAGQNPQNSAQMQQYQQMLQQQRAQQQRQQQILAMRQQQAMQQQGGGQQQINAAALGMNNMGAQGMQGMNLQQMQGMQGMQGMNMQQMQQMQGMQGMQGVNMMANMPQGLNATQMQQFAMMRQAQQRAAQLAATQQQQGQGGGDGGINWSGV